MGFWTHLLRNVTIHFFSDFFGFERRFRRRMQEDIDLGETFPADFSRENYVIFSDIHRGNRDSVDRFKNESIYFEALKYYDDKKYNLVLLGDIEECWGYKNRMDSLKQKNMILLKMEMNFVNRNKYFRIIGNHDDMWTDETLANNYLNVTLGNPRNIQNTIKPYRSVILDDNGGKILLIHGCQGQNFSDIGDKCGRGAVNWKFEHGLRSSKDEFAKKSKKLRKQERKILKWAKGKGYIVIMGHTHVPYFMSVPSTRLEVNSMNLLNKALGETDDRRYEKELWKSRANQEDIMKSIIKQKKILKKEIDKISKTLFNSGNCCKDKDEISAIEISGGIIKEVYWKKEETKPYVNNQKNLNDVFSLIQNIN